MNQLKVAQPFIWIEKGVFIELVLGVQMPMFQK